MQKITQSLSIWSLKQAYHVMLRDYLGHLATVQRLDRAYDILTRHKGYSIELVKASPATFTVTSPNDSYTVVDSQKLCTCPDAEILCKHRLAVKLILAAAKLQKEAMPCPATK